MHVDYYYSLNSPWAYLGSARFDAMCAKYGATVSPYPVDFGVIFPASGGLPLPKRAPQRQAYRLMELARWSRFHNIPLNPQPAAFPFAEPPIAAAIVALRETQGVVPAIQLSHRIMRALWAEDANPADPATFATLAAECGLDGPAILKLAQDPQWMDRRAADSHAALERGVFGAPSFVIEGEIFWGQDRLDFVERKLAGA